MTDHTHNDLVALYKAASHKASTSYTAFQGRQNYGKAMYLSGVLDAKYRPERIAEKLEKLKKELIEDEECPIKIL